ncbi:MAG: branched-chain amino acid ABC transporter permease, partial [Cyanobium sp. ELA507]
MAAETLGLGVKAETTLVSIESQSSRPAQPAWPLQHPAVYPWLLLVLPLLLLLKRTRFGRNVRAIAENDTAALLLGVPVPRNILAVFALSSGLAGLAGLMVALRFEQIGAYMGANYATKALAVIVIGGLGDVRGAMAAGLLLGVFEVLFQAYAPTGWSEAFVWLLLIGVFLHKPEGIFGTGVQRR